MQVVQYLSYFYSYTVTLCRPTGGPRHPKWADVSQPSEYANGLEECKLMISFKNVLYVLRKPGGFKLYFYCFCELTCEHVNASPSGCGVMRLKLFGLWKEPICSTQMRYTSAVCFASECSLCRVPTSRAIIQLYVTTTSWC